MVTSQPWSAFWSDPSKMRVRHQGAPATGGFDELQAEAPEERAGGVPVVQAAQGERLLRPAQGHAVLQPPAL